MAMENWRKLETFQKSPFSRDHKQNFPESTNKVLQGPTFGIKGGAAGGGYSQVSCLWPWWENDVSRKQIGCASPNMKNLDHTNSSVNWKMQTFWKRRYESRAWPIDGLIPTQGDSYGWVQPAPYGGHPCNHRRFFLAFLSLLKIIRSLPSANNLLAAQIDARMFHEQVPLI